MRKVEASVISLLSCGIIFVFGAVARADEYTTSIHAMAISLNANGLNKTNNTKFIPDDAILTQREIDSLVFEFQKKQKVYEQDLYYLTCAVYQEAGSDDCPDLMQQLVANVILNRVNHPDFANTIKSVLMSPHQYGNMWRDGISIPKNADSKAIERCRKNAKVILDGKRVCPSNVVYSSEFSSLGTKYKKFKTKNGWYYFNYKK